MNRVPTRLLMGSAAVMLGWSIPAHAQDQSKPADASGAADRREADDTSEIIVTAQKRDERLLETPISIQVLSGAVLDRGATRGVADALTGTGGVFVTQGTPGVLTISIRGIQPSTGASTIAYYQDEVPFGFNRASFLPDTGSFDLERIEVLRGPQGTLYGASAMSGVVRILTKDADLDNIEFKGRARVSDTDGGGGNHNVEVAGNVPIVPGKLAIRAVVGTSSDSGFIRSTFDAPGKKINDSDSKYFRLKLNWQATDRLNIKAQVAHSEFNSSASNAALDDLTTPFTAMRPDERKQNLYSLVGEYEAPGFTILSATSHIRYSSQFTDEIVAGTFRIPFTDMNALEITSQEIRLNSSLNGPWQWSAGAFYRDTKHKLTETAAPLFEGTFIQGDRSQAYAVFGELKRSFADDRLEILGGVRYFHDKATVDDLGDLDPAAVLVGRLTAKFKRVTWRGVLTYKPNRDLMFYGSVSTGFRSGALQSPAVVRIEPTFADLKPDSVITYEFGSKGALLERALTYDVAVYYTDWNNIQQFVRLPNGFDARVNSGKASGWGLDASLGYRLDEILSLNASAGWNGLKLDRDVTAGSAGATVALFRTGDRVNNSQEWTVSLGGTARIPVSGDGETRLVGTANYAYGSELGQRFLSGGTVIPTTSDPISTVRATLGLESDRWSLTVFADNLLNERGAVTARAPDQLLTAVRLRPRTIGIQLSFSH